MPFPRRLLRLCLLPRPLLRFPRLSRTRSARAPAALEATLPSVPTVNPQYPRRILRLSLPNLPPPDQPGQPVAYAQPMQQFNAAQSAQDIQPMRYSAEVPPASPAVQPVRKKEPADTRSVYRCGCCRCARRCGSGVLPLQQAAGFKAHHGRRRLRALRDDERPFRNQREQRSYQQRGSAVGQRGTLGGSVRRRAERKRHHRRHDSTTASVYSTRK